MVPEHWNIRHWLAFLLLHAADADGDRSRLEMKSVYVGLGRELVQEVSDWMEGHSTAELDDVLRAGLPGLVANKAARGKLQVLLRDIFLADGVYGEAEQAVTRRIGEWISGV